MGEAISIVENAHGLGAPVPAFVVDALAKAKKTIRLANTAEMRALTAKRKDPGE